MIGLKYHQQFFGAVFESTLNPETRRKGGMHYTSIENIHKVIDPLFLNEFKEELDYAKSYYNKDGGKKQKAIRLRDLHDFQEKLASKKIADFAAGSGNFLTETYLSLRRLENEVIREIAEDNFTLDMKGIIKVSIQQFYGIEINDFAVKVARTALWIAEAQMWDETRNIITTNVSIEDFLPLEEYNNIYEGNALTMDWNEVIPAEELDYIIGNPPFIGKKFQTPEQKRDLIQIFKKEINTLDYVTGWFVKSAEYIKKNTNIKVALVATNSIVQGEQVALLWEQMFKKDVEIIFAYKPFRWDSEANMKAHVHCVIIGFKNKNNKEKKNKYIFTEEKKIEAKNISLYLTDASNIFISSRTKPISKVKEMSDGNVPIDGNFLKLEPEEYEEFKQKEPQALKYIKKLVGSDEFINKKDRYVLWLVDCPPEELLKMPMTLEKVEKVREFRLNSNRKNTLKLADTPMLFEDTRNPDNALIIPRVSSEKRKYIPIGFIDKETIALNALCILPNADVYDFAILTSSVHMTWMRAVAGRLESRYRYSKNIVYNNFVWPEVNEEQRETIITKGQEILDVREKHKSVTYADMYGEKDYLFKELQKAHEENDKEVLKLYGLKEDASEEDILSKLFKMYEELS